mgnify:FL=1
MFRIDHPSRAAALPAPDPIASQGFFTKGDPSSSVPATRVTQDWLNAVQEELATAILDNGGVLDKGNRAGLSQAISRVAGGASNYLVNPEGLIEQRDNTGNVGTTESFGTVDRWLARTGTGDTLTLKGGAVTPTFLSGWPSRPRGVVRLEKTVDATSGTQPRLVQRVESALTLADADVVVAFDAFKFSGADLPIVSVELVQDFGTGGSPSADVTTALAAMANTTIDGTARRFSYRGHLPSVGGKTFGTGGRDHVKVRVNFGANTGVFAVYLSAFVLAKGNQDPGYLPRDLTTERHLCRRYYETSIDGPSWANFNHDTDPALWDTGFSGAGAVATLGRRFWTHKYRSPTVVWRAKDGTANNITEGASTLHPVTVGAGGDAPSPDHTGYPTITTPPASGTLRLFRAYYSADAEIVD